MSPVQGYGGASGRRYLLAWAWLPLLLTVVVRTGWLAAYPVDPLGAIDPEGFHLLAVNLLDGKGFAIGWEPPLCPTAVRTPLYPLFVAGMYALLGRLPERVVLLQVLLEVLTTALVMALVRELQLGRGATVAESSRRRHHGHRDFLPGGGMFLAGMLYAVNGLTPRFTGYLYAETFLLPLLSGALLLSLRTLRKPGTERSIPAGWAWGLVLLTKPNVQYLALAVGLLISYRFGVIKSHTDDRQPQRPGGRETSRATRPQQAARTPAVGLQSAGSHGNEMPAGEPLRASDALVSWSQRLRGMGGFWLALGLVLAPWVVRNRLVLGRWVLSTAFEENVARVSAVATEAALRGIAAEPWTESWEAIYDELEVRAVPALANPELDKADAPCDVQAAWQRQIAAEARRLVANHPATYVVVHVQGALRGLLDPGHRVWYRLLTGRDWSTTGVVPDIRQRLGWSLEQGAVGDALAAFWSQRIAHIPLGAGVVWWGLVTGQITIWVLTVRSLWARRRRPWVVLLLSGTLAYHILLPGPIAHDRFYVPIVPVIAALLAAVPSGKVRRAPGRR